MSAYYFTNKAIIGAYDRFSESLELEKSQIQIGIFIPTMEQPDYYLYTNYKLVRKLRFKEITGKKVDFAGEGIAASYIINRAIMFCKKYECEPTDLSLMICRDNHTAKNEGIKATDEPFIRVYVTTELKEEITLAFLFDEEEEPVNE